MWKRPTEVAYPKVWSRFECKGLSGERVLYHIQDLPPEHFNDAIQLMKTYFLTDEVLCKTIKLLDDPASVKSFEDHWSKSLQQKMAIGCYETESTRLVGVNFLFVSHKDTRRVVHSDEGEKFQYAIAVLDHLFEELNIFEKFGIDHFLNAYGMGVRREFRSRGLATELLKARIPIMKAMGIPYTATFFTGNAPQRAAARAGYETYLAVEYTKFEKFEDMDVKYAKVMGIKA